MTCSFNGCERPVYAHGLCNPHSLQRRRGRQLQPIRVWPATLIERFMLKVGATMQSALRRETWKHVE